jgi:hypothetical protein
MFFKFKLVRFVITIISLMKRASFPGVGAMYDLVRAALLHRDHLQVVPGEPVWAKCCKTFRTVTSTLASVG